SENVTVHVRRFSYILRVPGNGIDNASSNAAKPHDLGLLPLVPDLHTISGGRKNIDVCLVPVHGLVVRTMWIAAFELIRIIDAVDIPDKHLVMVSTSGATFGDRSIPLHLRLLPEAPAG